MTGYDDASLSHVEEIDRALTEIQRQIGFLLNITPTNSNEAWLDFEKSGFSTVPMLQSRPLRFDPDLIKRRLFDLAIERVDEAGLAILLRQKRDELCRQVMLLEVARKMTKRLAEDGMLFVGIDIVGDKVVEINAESPGGFQSVEHYTGIDFSPAIIDALEQKLARP